MIGMVGIYIVAENPQYDLGLFACCFYTYLLHCQRPICFPKAHENIRVWLLLEKLQIFLIMERIMEDFAIPVIFIHQGYPTWYLWHTLRQVFLTNPRSKIYLIDNKKKCFHPIFVSHFSLTEYFSTEAINFTRTYIHLSPNPYFFELFCFQRWFILKDFMLRNQIDKCIYLDSDVMTYTNFSEEMGQYSRFGLTLTRGCSPHNCYVNGPKALDNFCRYVSKIYEITTTRKELYAVFEDFSKISGGIISDMAVFYNYARDNPGVIGDNHVFFRNSTYDNNIHESEGFEMYKGLKRIFWKNGIPFGRHDNSGKMIRFHTLHFQGYSKRYIPRYASNKDIHYYIREPAVRLRSIAEKFR